jgi:hypothetical protein
MYRELSPRPSCRSFSRYGKFVNAADGQQATGIQLQQMDDKNIIAIQFLYCISNANANRTSQQFQSFPCSKAQQKQKPKWN